MFITVVNGQITNHYPSLVEVTNSMRLLDPFAASYVEIFQYLGDGNEVLKNQRRECCETGEGITPTNLDKYRHKVE